MRPRITLASGNIPVVMWGGGNGTQPLWAARYNGPNFNTPIRITPMNVDPFIDNWAGAQMAAEGNNVFVVFKRQPEMMNYIYTVKSSNGGMTWQDTVRVTNGTGTYTRFPAIAVSPGGNPVVGLMVFDTTWMNAEYQVSNSPDGGQTYGASSPASITGGSDVCDCCPAGIISEGMRQVVAYRRNNNNLRDIWMSLSTDGGTTFPLAADLDNTDWLLAACPSTGPDLLINGDTLYSVWMSQGEGAARSYINALNLNTLASGFSSVIGGNYPANTTQNYPQIAGNLDTIGVVWQQQDFSGNIESFFSWSVSGPGGLINNEIVLNSSSSGAQQNPDIAYADGKFYFAFQDNSNTTVKFKTATINNTTGLNENENISESVSVFPNPFSTSVTIVINSKLQTLNPELILFDVLGNEVFKSTIPDNRLKISRGEMASGIYFYRVLDKGKILGSGKIIIQ